MIRRSRISVRPNVKPSGRVTTASRDASQDNPPAAPADLTSESGVKTGVEEVRPAASAPAVESNNNPDPQSDSVQPQPDITPPAGDAAAQSPAAGSVPTSGPQRRKRFTVLPNLARPRTSPAPARTSSRTPRSPIKAPVTTPEPSEPAAPDPPPQEKTTSASRGKRRPSGGGRQPKAQPKPEPPIQVSSAPSAEPSEKDHGAVEKNEPSPANQNAGFSYPAEKIQSESATISESPAQAHEIQLVSLEKETPVEEQGDGVSPENAQSNLQTGGTQSQSTAHVPLALRTINDPMDRARLAKARKLRELLRKEMNKDKKKEKHQRPKMWVKTCKTAKDHTKMTMRELIYYLPPTNPMKSYAEDEQKVTETVLPSSPAPPAPPAVPAASLEDGGEEEEETAGSGTGEEEPSLAPRVKVAEDGSLIIDEESLTVEVLRVKGPNPAEDRDPIFERGSTTTYSSFRKGTYTKPWSNKETDMFFLAISMVGTDFSMIGQLFPHRARIEIKNKFKKEERANSWRIDKAFKERRRLDLEFFNNLLEKILQDEEKKRKKKKDGAKLPKASGSTQRKSAARRKRGQSSAGSEEEESSGSDVMEGEKENEGVSNDGGSSTTPTISPKRKRAKMKKQMNKAGMVVVEDGENLKPEGQPPVDRLQDPDLEVENCASSGIKPAQQKDRVRRPAPNLLRRWRNSSVQKKDQETSTEEESGKTKLSKKSTDVGSIGLEDSEEEEEPDLTAVQEHILNKPTRSGRIPKLSQHVMRAVADEDEEEVEKQSAPPPETRGPNTSARRTRKKPGPSLKQGMLRRGKSRLVTLRASAAEEEEDDDEDYDTTQDEEQYLSDAEEEENQAFVPMGLRTHPQVHTEVEETVEELDMCVNVPDVLGISQNAVCPESSCARSLGPGGTVPCEHQLDLLVDVIEFLAPEPMEVSEESSTEAARTLLTIGHSAHLIPAVETSDEDDDDDNLIIIEEPSMFPQHEVQQEVILETTEHIETGENENVHVVTSDPSVGVIAECKDGPESASIVSKDDPNQDVSRAGVAEASKADCGPVEESVSSQGAESLPESSSSEVSNTKTSEQTAPQTRRNRLPRPKPNLGRASRPLKDQQKQRLASPESEAVEKPAPVSLVRTTTTEDQLDESKPSKEASAESQKVLDDSPAVFVEREAKNPQLSLEKEHEDEGSEVNVFKEGENEEKRQERLQMQQPNSSESASAVIESSVQPSQPSRRCRGPKPKPNLVRSSRTTHPHTQKKPAQPAEVPTEESATVNLSTATLSDSQTSEEANISQHQIQQETPSDSKMEVCSNVGLEEYSGPVSKQDTSEKKETAHITDDEDDDDVQIVSVEASEPMTEVFSEEPVYILSLTEVPPTAAEKQDLTQSESLSETRRAADCMAGDPASHLGLSNMFAPISEDEEEKEEEEEKEMDVKHENKGIEDEGLRQINKREYSLLNQKNPVEEGPAEQHGDQSLGCKDAGSEVVTHPAKRPKLPERGRRAKLQVKPNPVQRKGLRTQPATTAGSPVPASEEGSSAPASSQQTSSRSEDPVLLSTFIKDSSSTSHSPAERTKPSNTAPTDTALPPALSRLTTELISLPSAQSASIEAPPTTNVPHTAPHTAPQVSSKDSVKQENLPETPVGAEDSEPSGLGVEPQPVHQITPLATTGPLTRPGRRPRGFLSFMSSTSTQGPSSASRGSAAGPQKPAINTSRTERRRAAPGPLTSASRSASTSQKSSRLNPSPASSSQSPTVTSTPELQVSAEPETHKPDTNPSTEEEEPTSVSAYFFSDIFTMVDEQEEME